MKMTFQPKKRQRAKVHGFRARMKTAGGRKVMPEELKVEQNYLLNCFKLKAKELRATASCGLFFSYLPGKRGVF